MTDEPQANPAFDRWTLRAKDDRHRLHGEPVPLLTTVLYRVCDNDEKRFEEAIRAMRLAFEAGQCEGKAGP